MNHEQILVPGRRLGRWPKKYDRRTLQFSKYAKALPPPPDNSGYVDAVSEWPMELNDTTGDCTIACADHQILQWTTYAKPPGVVISEAATLKAYMAVSGFNPNDPSSDQGANILDVLKYWRKTGIGGHKIKAFAAVDPADRVAMKQAVMLFGSVNIGVDLPITAQDPATGINGKPVWATPDMGPVGDGAPWSWGGHCVPIVGYGVDHKGNHGTMVVTWGQLYDATWGFLDLYCSEAWAIITDDWFAKDGLAPSGFDMAQLMADLAQL